MKTRKVEIYCDLYPGWQDSQSPCVSFTTAPFAHKADGVMRIRAVVELPCFGGSAGADMTVPAPTEVMKEGLQC